jgi:hypothetical protein
MATSLINTTPADTYVSLLKLGDNSALSASLKRISDGAGNDTPMEISTAAVQFGGSTGMFWNNTNKDLSIGVNEALGNKLRVQGSVRILNLLLGGGNNTISATGGGAVINVLPAGVGIATTAITPTAYLQVRGTGTTTATTALRVENSAGTATFTVADNGNANISATSLFYFGDTSNFIRKSNTIDGVSIGGFSAVGIGAFGGLDTFVVRAGSASLGATTANASALLDMVSTTKGFLPPRMTTTQKNAISSPAAGLVVYDTTTNKLSCYDGSTWNDLF